MDVMSHFLISALGTVTVSTPSFIAARTWSTLAFSGKRKRCRNLPLLRSTQCQLSVPSSLSIFRSPLIWRIRPSSTSTFSSSFLSPGRSALKTCASGVSFQSTRAPTKAEDSLGKYNGEGRGRERRGVEGPNVKPSRGSHGSGKKGSKALIRREPNPKPPGMRAILGSKRSRLANEGKSCGRSGLL
ncbi:unnamed protein product [Musa hybrid cultivar]